MQSRSRMLQLGVILVIVVGALVATFVLTSDNDDTESDDATDIRLFMSFVPSVQFAPVYVALERDYFAEEGLNVTIEHGNESDGLERIASGDLRFGLISGDQVILARGQDRPVVYVFEWYHNYPVGIVSSVEQDILAPEDLADRVVGIPGPFGASYIGLHALLNAGGLTEADLGELRPILYTAPENICAGNVDAAVVYVTNEPLTIEQQCTEVNVMQVSDYMALVSNGLVTNEQTIAAEPELVRGMVRAIQRGIADTLNDPDAAFEIALEKYVYDLPESEHDTQRQVLENSLELWASEQVGMTNPEAWEQTQALLIETGLLAGELDDLSAAYDMQFLPDTAD